MERADGEKHQFCNKTNCAWYLRNSNEIIRDLGKILQAVEGQIDSFENVSREDRIDETNS